VCKVTRFVTSAAAISLAASSATMFAADAGTASAVPPSTTGATTVPLRQFLRNCDFSMIPYVGGTGQGSATSVIAVAGRA
jgi:hypothetical protein